MSQTRAKALLEGVQRVLRGFADGPRAEFVQRSLECLGRAAGVDRAYVFENGALPDGSLAASQRFEWCAPGIPPTLGAPQLQNVPYEAAGMGRWLELFQQCSPVAGHVEEFPEPERALLEPQAILSLAVVPIHVDGELWGFVGFDSVRTRREWTADMLSALLAAASAIGQQESRVRAERELVDSRQRFERAVRGAQGGIYDWDLRAERVWYSPSFAELLGLQPDDLGDSVDAWQGRIHTQDAARVERALRAHLDHGVPYEQTYRLQHRDGSWRWVQDRGMAERAVDGPPPRMSGTVVDITELRRLQDMVHRSQRLEAVGRLAGGVAHDFNNMLSVILGYAELLQREIPADDPRARYVREVSAAAERSARITGQLLAFARKQVTDPQTVDTHQLLRDMQGLVESLLGESCRLQLKIPKGAGGAVRLDVGQFEQVLANLATNARDAMPKGGTLTVEVATVDLDVEYARVHPGCEPGRYVCVAVSDTGEGMSDETLEHIFEPFFTTKSVGRGTGLGLASAKGIVERAGGFLRVYSELGRGTTFKIYLPMLDAVPTSPVVPSSSTRPASGHEDVLVVEDQTELRAMMVEALREAGYQVAQAHSVASAREVLAATRHLDLLITDIVLPDGTGDEIVQPLGEKHADARVLFTSGYTENVVLEQGMKKPGTAFVAKPLTPSLLARKVRSVLDGEDPTSGESRSEA